MKKVTLLLILPFIAIAAFLNPSEYKFKDEVKYVYSSNKELDVDTIADVNLEDKISSLGNIIADSHINSKVNTDNYLIFSIGKWEDNYIGYGFFDNVYLTNEFKEKVESIE